MAYALCGQITARAGEREALVRHLLDAAEALRDEASCQLYVVNRAVDDRDAVWVMEVWEDAAAHQASLRLPAVQALIAAARPVIAGMGQRVELEAVGGKGLGVA